MNKNEIDPASFRDPSGFIFLHEGTLYRQVNPIYKEHYDRLMESGLYKTLVDHGLLIPHIEVEASLARSDNAYKVLKPEPIPFLSYPYEWCFSQLKDAALTTMRIQKMALDHGMILKDSSAYNIQFMNGKPVFIDTLSFEKYREGEPWVAYRQFCQNFLAPLALMSYRDIRLNQLFRVYMDGIPLDLASALLPVRTKFRFSLATHIHLHAKAQKRYADKTVPAQTRKIGRLALLGIIDNLESAVRKLNWNLPKTEWSHYYEETNYSAEGLTHKKQLVAEWLESTRPRSVWDLGANTGLFGRLAGGRGILTIAFDADPAAVELNYREGLKNGDAHLLPLLLDLTNPSPAIGYENKERMSLLERGPADTVLALALLHHLAISNNVPLDKIAVFFSGICKSLIIEFVPKSDSQVQRLLSARADIFTDYNQHSFETVFMKYFALERSTKIRDSERILYLMRKESL